MKTSFNISLFEEISENQENQLTGGFSTVVTSHLEVLTFDNTNNCQGGNCVKGCGSNDACNTVAGCGSQK